ncbi:MAG: class C sortase, partial [Clostridiaceae bacterium]
MSSELPKKKKKKKSRIKNIIITLIFVLGLSIAAYPIISRLYYTFNAAEQVTKFEVSAKELTSDEVKKRIELARAFNESIQSSSITDPYTDAQKAAGKAEYARMLEIHEQMGHIEIPKINIDIPIFAGTAEVVLQKGAGHLEGTSLPVGGNSTHSVITAHSGLPTARLFSDLNKLQIGDKFYVHNV